MRCIHCIARGKLWSCCRGSLGSKRGDQIASCELMLKSRGVASQITTQRTGCPMRQRESMAVPDLSE